MTFVEYVILIGCLLGVVLRFAERFFKAAIRIRLEHWDSADMELEPCEDSGLAPDVNGMKAALKDLGFAVRGQWLHRGHSLAMSQITLMEQPRTLDVARILATSAGKVRSLSLVFQTRFEDGTEVATANNQLISGLPKAPESTILWLPEVRDERRLFRVHDQVRDYLGPNKRRLSIGKDPVAFQTAERNRNLARFVETGHYFFDQSAGVYRRTWKGALLLTWRAFWPVRPVYRAWRHRQTSKLLRELGIHLEVE
jgi:hypothetical protein